MRAFLYRKWFHWLKRALATMPAASIAKLGTWIAANPPASDSAAHRRVFFKALQDETVLGGDAVTPD
jgi:hypothetical protein